MSTLQGSPNESDSEDDPDYVPPKEDALSSDEDEPQSKRARTSASSPKPVAEEDDAEKKKRRDALWASFQVSAGSTNNTIKEEDFVKVEKRYRFAGEDVVEVVQVHKDSAEAKKWPLWKQDQNESQPQAGSSRLPSAGPCATETPPTSASTPVGDPPPKKPGPRKPRTTLAALPTKAKKMSTLDKSALDWRTHVGEGPGLRDELEANRRGGGYLEKVEFLQRVEERREDVLESSKSSKRRRG